MKNKNILSFVVVAIISLGIGFGGGIKYQSSKKPDFVNQFSNRNGFNQDRGQAGLKAGGAAQANPAMRGGNRPVAGEIISSDSKSLTVKQPDGSNKIILLSSTTQINKAQSAVVSDLKVGEKVSIFGTTNPDGSVTAQNVQLNPQMLNTATPSATPKK